MREEVWLRGPVAGVPPLLQPVAHALLQAREEVRTVMQDFPDECLWLRPAGVASPGFHLQHLTGVADRLFTYANGQPLSAQQLESLSREQEPPGPGTTATELVERFHRQVDLAVQQLKHTNPASITDFRPVGRAQLPSTVAGLLFHAAEHTQRHVGQLYVTVKIVLDELNKKNR